VEAELSQPGYDRRKGGIGGARAGTAKKQQKSVSALKEREGAERKREFGGAA